MSPRAKRRSWATQLPTPSSQLRFKHHPAQLACLDRDRTKHLLVLDLGGDGVGADGEVAHGEVSGVQRMGVVFVAVCLGVGEGSFRRFSLHDAVDPGLGY